MGTNRGSQRYKADLARYRNEMADFWPSGMMFAAIAVWIGWQFGPAAFRSIGGAIGLVVIAATWSLGGTLWFVLFSRVAREWWAVRRAGADAILLTLDQQGVTLHLLGVQLGWSEIGSVAITSKPLFPQHGMPARGRQPQRRTLLFYPARATIADTGGLARLPKNRRAIGKRQQILYGTPFTVEGAHLDAPIAQVIAAIERMGAHRVQRLGVEV